MSIRLSEQDARQEINNLAALFDVYFVIKHGLFENRLNVFKRVRRNAPAPGLYRCMREAYFDLIGDEHGADALMTSTKLMNGVHSFDECFNLIKRAFSAYTYCRVKI